MQSIPYKRLNYKKENSLNFSAFQMSFTTYLLFVHFCSISSVPLSAKCQRCSGQIFRCLKSRARDHWACITLFCFKDRVDLIHLRCRFTAHVADTVLCRKSSACWTHYAHKHTLSLTSQKRETLLLKVQMMASILV